MLEPQSEGTVLLEPGDEAVLEPQSGGKAQALHLVELELHRERVLQLVLEATLEAPEVLRLLGAVPVELLGVLVGRLGPIREH